MIATGNEFVSKRLEISRAYRRVMFWVKVRWAFAGLFIIAIAGLPVLAGAIRSIEIGAWMGVACAWYGWLPCLSKFIAERLDRSSRVMIHEEMAKAIEQ